MFDVTRLAAAYSIVWIHTPRSEALALTTRFARFAVPFFVCATIFFIWQGLVGKSARGLGGYAASRFNRIYVPFLGWSLIYLAFKAAKSLALPDQPNDFPGIEFLWTGSFLHLWFMPFIMVVSLVVFVIARPIVHSAPAEIAVAVVSVVAGGVLAASPCPAAWLQTILQLAWDALPAVFWGMALAVAYHRGGAKWFDNSLSAVFGLCVLVACMAWVWNFGRNNIAENLAGVGCTLVALAPWNSGLLAALGRFGPLAYGIYLSHLLFIKTAEAVLNKLARR